MNTQVKELTLLAVVIGVIIGVVMTAANVYLGLYAGMTVSASIPAAVISMAIFKLLKRQSILQTNIVQTMASAGESLAAGVIFTLPALVIVGAWKDFEFWPTTLIALSGGLLGIIFMIPLRKVLIENEQDLSYPEGVACAEVLKVGDNADNSSALAIFKGLAIGGVFKLFSSGFKIFTASFEKAKILNGSSYFLGLDISPALLAVGYIVNLNVAILVMLGGLIGFSIAIPMLHTPIGMENLSAVDLAWTLWSGKVRYLGVGAMIVGGVWSIMSVRKGISSGLKGLSYKNSNQSSVDMGIWPMMIILITCFSIMLGLYNSMIQNFGISLLTTLLMLVCSFLFVAVSSYIVGLVGSSNNPVSGMTISALLVSAALFLSLGFNGDSAILCTLGVAAVVCCAACTAGDCSQDLKTGSIVGATPKYQQWAQVIGVVIPAFVIAPVLTLLHKTQGIGTGLKAPQATLFASITKALFGQGELPQKMVLIGAFLAIVILVIDGLFLKGKKFRLHLMPIAVGIYLPATLAVPIFIGGFIRFIAQSKRVDVEDYNDKGILLSSGLIAGEALMGVFLAIVTYVGFSLYKANLETSIVEYLSLSAFVALATYVYKVAKK